MRTMGVLMIRPIAATRAAQGESAPAPAQEWDPGVEAEREGEAQAREQSDGAAAPAWARPRHVARNRTVRVRRQ